MAKQLQVCEANEEFRKKPPTKISHICPECSSTGQSILKGKRKKLRLRETVVTSYGRTLRKNSSKLQSLAIACRDSVCTFETVESLSNQLAIALNIEVRNLMSSNKDGDLIIGFCSLPSETAVMLMLAIMKIGASYMSLDVMLSTEMLVRQVAVTRPIAIIVEDKAGLVSRFEAVANVTKILPLSYLLAAAEGKDPSILAQIPVLKTGVPPWERTAAIAFSSGMASYPQSVRISHRSILNSVQHHLREFPFGGDEVACLSAPTESVSSILQIFAPLTKLVPFVILQHVALPRPERLAPLIETYRISRISMQPHHLHLFLNYLRTSCSKALKAAIISQLKYIYCTQLPLPVNLGREFFQVFHNSSDAAGGPLDGGGDTRKVSKCALVSCYGSTELSGNVTYRTYRSEEDFHFDNVTGSKIDLGRPIWNTVVYIMSSQQRVVNFGVKGEICVAGLAISNGYSGTGNEGAPEFLLNPYSKACDDDTDTIYRTGDYGRIILDKTKKPLLFYERRMDSEVSCQGRVYDLVETSRLIVSTKLVQDCVVLCYRPNQEDQRIIAACVLQPKATERQVSKELVQKLGQHFVVEVFSIEYLPFQSNGKVDRHGILQQYEEIKDETSKEKSEKWAELKLPAGKLEEAKEVLPAISGVLNLTVNHLINHFESSFYELGGDSLNTVAVVSTLCLRSYPISLDEFVSSKSLKEVLAKASAGRDKLKNAKSRYMLLDFYSSTNLADTFFSAQELTAEHSKESISKILCDAYVQKSLLCLYTKVSTQNIKRYLLNSANWDPFLQSGASAVGLSQDNKTVVGAILCQEYRALKRSRSNKDLQNFQYMRELLSWCQTRAVKQIQGTHSKVLLMELMATDTSLKPHENTLLLQLLLKKAMSLARDHRYQMAIIVSENAAVTNVCRDTVKYNLIEEIRLNEFQAANHTFPFQSAPNHERVSVYCRYFDY